MPRKSNKTSHVLNLLAGETDAKPSAEAPAPSPVDNTAAAVPEVQDVPEEKITAEETPYEEAAVEPEEELTIETPMNSTDDPLSELIRESLETEAADLPPSQESISVEPDQEQPETAIPEEQPPVPEISEEIPEITPVIQEEIPAPEPVTPEEIPTSAPVTPEAIPVPEPVTPEEIPSPAPVTPEEIPVPEPVTPEEIPGPAPVIPEAIPVAEPVQSNEMPEPNEPTLQEMLAGALTDNTESPTQQEPEDLPFRFTNVMEYIVKDMVMNFMEQFEMCTCQRCITDTIALTLTSLPAKYIVVDKHSVSPLLNFYSNKYVSQVVVELTKACIVIRDNPRHQE